MSWFKNMKIAAKLIAGFVVVALIAGIVGVVGIINIININDADTELYEINTVPITDLATANEKYQRARLNMLNIIINTDSQSMNENMTKINQFLGEMQVALDNFGKNIINSQISTEYNSLMKTVNEDFLPYTKQVTDLAMSNKGSEAHQLTKTKGDELNKNIQAHFDNLFKLKVDDASKKSNSNSSAAQTAIVMMTVFIAVGMLLAVGLGLFISRIISNPVKKLVEAADRLSIGDVEVNVEAESKDEIGTLMLSFSRMVENIRGQAVIVEKMAAGDLTIDVKVRSDKDLLGKKLSEMIETNNEVLGNINLASEQVALGARQVSSSSQMLSQGSTEQASSVEEITSSMTQVAAQTRQNAQNASLANELAVSARENASKGNSQMQEMVKAMAEINESSSNISKIIKVIDEIAFQTNILALNAAVEAARAGQHGKGFAVVAEEVRNLAARSANAAKETTEMIEGSIKKVEVGTRIANETAAALDEIVGGVSKAAALVGDIAAASNEQAAGISQINTAIEQVAQVVQTNSATAEECAAASEELSGQADMLKESVSRFRLKKIKASYASNETLTPEMLRLIEGMIDKRKNREYPGMHEEEAAASKLKISLDDKDYGKY
ncbi:methyl-accepting chemotaxis protein II [Ruminiclostridium hungatei]|uniref:Methyl-accepting chemotaxis protein II n=1 Tax=Ruminiclostridium hungatei TaxID=48256 RepID=A0A1V4SQX2_RUMHU|nr:HAMP domain-containing methyl-accepting chemotaxis protein [Ruminiclostridium hungatei]OPX45845.1 methyl-accepting chemotaxis protein II [Ruminiclostridium hungatei]